MFYYLYEIINLKNSKIYVGVHKTKSMDDGYMGSGKVINAAIKKYGIENFTKVILEMFDDSVSMYAREKEVVTEEFLSRKDVYNLRRGGVGGFDHINKRKLNNTKHSKIKRLAALEKGRKIAKELGISILDFRLSGFKSKRQQQNALKCAQSPIARKRRKASYKKINHQQGIKNSQFGKMWITNERESRSIRKTDPIPTGWRKGRSMVV